MSTEPSPCHLFGGKMGKVEKGLYRAISVIFGAVILPVLFCVFFIGMKMHYTEGMKPHLALSNPIIFLIALLLAAGAVFLIYLGSKHPLEKKGNIILTCVIAALSVGLLFISNKIAREIAFYLPWDVDVVAGSAMQFADAEPLGYQYYYSIYTNNIPIVYILGKIMRTARESGYSLTLPFVWVQVGCVLTTISVFFLAMTVKRVTKNLWAVIVSFLAGVALIGLSAWVIAPYTDVYGLPFPILCLYFFVCHRQSKKTIGKVLFLAASVLAVGIGGMLKPNLYLLFIALFMTELLCVLGDAKKNILYLAATLLLIALTFFGTKLYTKGMPEKMGLVMNDNLEAGVPEYFFMGQNPDTTGSYSEVDVYMYGEFQDVPRKERDKIIWGRAVDRMKDKGALGLADFWLNKMTMTFNDGSFGWLCEVWIEKHYEPVVSSNKPIMDFLRSIYWFGPRTPKYGACCQIIWFALLIGLPGNLLYWWKKKKEGREEPKSADYAIFGMMMISFLGVFFYQMLFEARARYLYVFLPMIIVFAVAGLSRYAKIAGLLFHGKKGSKQDE